MRNIMKSLLVYRLRKLAARAFEKALDVWDIHVRGRRQVLIRESFPKRHHSQVYACEPYVRPVVRRELPEHLFAR